MPPYIKYGFVDNVETVDNTASKLTYDEFLVEEKKSLGDLEASELTEDISIAPYIRSIQKDAKSALIISSILSVLALLC